MARTPISLPFDGSRLRTARERAGYSQEDLAKLCTKQGTCVSRFQVVRAEGGRYKPQARVLAAFVRALNIKLDDLLTPGEGVKRECAP